MSVLSPQGLRPHKRRHSTRSGLLKQNWLNSSKDFSVQCVTGCHNEERWYVFGTDCLRRLESFDVRSAGCPYVADENVKLIYESFVCNPCKLAQSENCVLTDHSVQCAFYGFMATILFSHVLMYRRNVASKKQILSYTGYLVKL